MTKPYDDPDCKCHEIEKEIDAKHNGTWNCGKACEVWLDRKSEIEDNGINFEGCSDAAYSCTCPACGRVVCSWCV
jgi:hypothetical protein